MIRDLIAKNSSKKFHLVNNPEFLKEGSAIEDFMRPDRVIIGHSDQYAADIMAELYEPLVRQGNPIYMMSNLSAEMTKYAANCFLATKISFINEIAKLCDLTGADIDEVRKGISSDKRIGGQFFYPGPGYGGSCFPKDVRALIHTAKNYGMELEIVQSTQDVNEKQKSRVFEKMEKHFEGNLTGKTFAFWGVAFKANTDDIRESPAITMARNLATAGANVRFFDPVASDNFEELMNSSELTKGKIVKSEGKYDCLKEADALVVMTEWREFQSPDFDEIKKLLKTPVIFDGRNLYKTKRVLEYGFEYYGIGRRILK
jgi:UDPglucose 6-dehydrogenase